MTIRRICFFTGSRADYSSLLPIMTALRDDSDVDLKLLVSGGHLVPAQGYTVRQLTADGFVADVVVDMVLANDTPTAVAKSFGLGVAGYADALDRLDPDLLVALGDRYEALAVAASATFRLLPVAHISGGEVTKGSTDDPIRHAISKLCHLHFTATEDMRHRVIQLGEHPDTVFNTGAPTIDSILTAPLPSREAWESTYERTLGDPTIAVTYHPVTADPDASRQGLAALLDALPCFPDATVVFTGTNVDQGGSTLAQHVQDYVTRHPQQAIHIASLGKLNYLSLIRHANVVVGNSSSGIAEAPALQTATVNIGSRQEGRPRADSVIDCGETTAEVRTAIERALSDEMRERARYARSPYGDGTASERIVKVLKKTDLESLIPKGFFDLPNTTCRPAAPPPQP